MRFTRFASLCASALALASSAVPGRQVSAKRGSPELPESRPLVASEVEVFLARSSRGRATLEKIIEGATHGMTGIVFKIDGLRLVGWMPPRGSALLVGSFLNAEAENLTATAMRDHGIPRPARTIDFSLTPAESGLIDAAAKADGLTEGSDGPLIHVLVDLSCGYCAEIHRQLAPLIAQRRLRVHWIPVAVVNESSTRFAADLLQKPKSSAAQSLARHFESYDPHTGKGGLAGVTATLRIRQTLAANGELLKVVSNETRTTAAMIFLGGDGKAYSHAGLPLNAFDIVNAVCR